MAHAVMAEIVTASIVVADALMAYVVVAYILMAYVVMAVMASCLHPCLHAGKPAAHRRTTIHTPYDAHYHGMPDPLAL